MFKFRTVIVDDIDTLKKLSPEEFDRKWHTLYGEIELCIGKYYIEMLFVPEIHGDPPQGRESLEEWFNDFLDALLVLLQGGNYAAFRQMSANLDWVVAERLRDIVRISIAQDRGVIHLATECIFDYAIPTRFCTHRTDALLAQKEYSSALPFREFYRNIISETAHFLKQTIEINPTLQSSKMYKEIQKKMNLAICLYANTK